jgi:3-methyladenine DNA glycosylase/8-oxoguanine DNA glycosylase
MALVYSDLKEFYLDLKAIDAHLESAAFSILNGCEELLEEEIPPGAQNIVNSILESCNFHDINSQRIRRMLKKFESLANEAAPDKVKVAPAPKDTIMSGPQRPGKALTQREIEDLLK